MISLNSKVLLLGIFALSFAGVCSQYQQECHSLDSVMNTLIRNMASVSMGTAPSCIKSADCTSMSCYFDLMGTRTEMTIKLSPCSDPPQMTFVLKDSSGKINLKANITHQTTFPLPSIGIVQSSIRVDFQPVANGVQFGLFLVTSTFGVPITTPIVADQVISTPPCSTSPVPMVTGGNVLAVALGSEKCKDMEDMLAQAHIPNGFVCHSHQDCNGFQCNGTVQDNDLQVSLHIDPCSTPVSYNITITSTSMGLVWSHNFTHTETVNITPGSPLEFFLDVTMSPDPSGNTIITTIQIRGCTTVPFVGQQCPINEVLLDKQPVPVPPCALPSLSPTPPTVIISANPTISTECTTWAGIIHSMLHSANDLGTMTCNVTTNCTGIVCLDTVSGHEYVARLDLRHCATPVELWMSIKSDDGNVNWQQTVTHGDIIAIPGTSDSTSFNVTLEKRDDKNVELGLEVKFTILGFSYSETLIEDQLIPVGPCNGDPTMKAYGMGTTLIDSDKPNKIPISGEGGSNNIGIVFGVLLAGLVVLCVIAGLLYFKRRRRFLRADERALVEDSFAEI